MHSRPINHLRGLVEMGVNICTCIISHTVLRIWTLSLTSGLPVYSNSMRWWLLFFFLKQLTGTAAIRVGWSSDASPLLPFLILVDWKRKNEKSPISNSSTSEGVYKGMTAAECEENTRWQITEWFASSHCSMDFPEVIYRTCSPLMWSAVKEHSSWSALDLQQNTWLCLVQQGTRCSWTIL